MRFGQTDGPADALLYERTRLHLKNEVWPGRLLANKLDQPVRVLWLLAWFSLYSLVCTLLYRFNYSREDEEIYKEFMEINNELIPHLMKTVTMSENNGEFV